MRYQTCKMTNFELTKLKTKAVKLKTITVNLCRRIAVRVTGTGMKQMTDSLTMNTGVVEILKDSLTPKKTHFSIIGNGIAHLAMIAHLAVIVSGADMRTLILLIMHLATIGTGPKISISVETPGLKRTTSGIEQIK